MKQIREYQVHSEDTLIISILDGVLRCRRFACKVGTAVCTDDDSVKKNTDKILLSWLQEHHRIICDAVTRTGPAGDVGDQGELWTWELHPPKDSISALGGARSPAQE